MSAPVVRAELLASLVRLPGAEAVYEGAVVLVGDVLERLRALPDASVNCVVTSPPYLDARDYGVPPTSWPEVTYRPRFDLPAVTVPAEVCCLGHESTLVAYVAHLVVVWRELRRVLRADGVCWLNLGSGYSAGTTAKRKPTTTQGPRVPAAWAERCHGGRVRAGLRAKQLIPAPSAARDALQADGWYVRNEVVWAKRRATPSSVRDRCTPSHEAVFLLTKRGSYRSHFERLATPAIAGASRNRARKHGPDHRGEGIPWSGETAHPRDVWWIATERVNLAHTATFPTELARRCVESGSDPGEVVLDPFAGTGTALAVARHLGRAAVGVEAQPSYVAMMPARADQVLARLRSPRRDDRRDDRPKPARRAKPAPAAPRVLDAISPLTFAAADHGPLFAKAPTATEGAHAA